MSKLLRTLLERRVPHVLAIYAGASWGVVEFVSFAVDEFLLSPHWTRVALLGLLLFLPTALMLAWFHGRPGRDQDGLARTEKIGIPANVVLCGAVLWMLFGGEDLGAATTSVTFETEEGEVVEREVAKAEFRKRTVLFPLDPGAGLDEEDSWLAYAVPSALEYDLSPDEFFDPIPYALFRERLSGLGMPDLLDIPSALKRELAEERYAEFFGAGRIERTDEGYRVALRLHEVDDGSVVAEAFREGPDLLALIDELSPWVKDALGIPAREGIEDVPVRDWLSADSAAVEEYFRGSAAFMVDNDLDEAIGHMAAAAGLDPAFTSAQFSLYLFLLSNGRTDEALVALRTAMANLYRIPERHRFIVKAEYYFVAQDVARAAAVIDMWAELHPEDPQALRYQLIVHRITGDSEAKLATLAALQRLDPRDGGVLKEIAAAQEELGNDGEALEALAEYVERFPHDETGYASLAGLQRRRGEHDQARANLERAILIEPLAPGLAGALASLDLRTGNFDDARAGFERAIELARTPAERADALEGLKHYHRFRGETGEAIRVADAWLEEASGAIAPMVLSQMRAADLEIYLDAGWIADAADFLDESKARIPPPFDNYLVPYLESRLALASGDLEAAREAHDATRRVAQAMGHGELLESLQRLQGEIDEAGGDYESAIAQYRAVMATENPGPGLHRDLGRALGKAGRLDEAEAELRDALRPIPAHPRTHFEIALVLEARGDAAGAAEHLHTALVAWETADEKFAPARAARAKLAELDSS
ncbi:MAG: tetratricopeptide repeat protein [Gemmatimonadota bacterium]|nr:tetratricopeptide repeat protein [Gemmatimonadota bacterium]